MEEKQIKKQLVIIGAGPGGYPAAFLAADLGMEVLLIDPETHPGGVCLFRGCIPTKTLLHLSRLLHECGAASAWGLVFQKPELHLEHIREWKESVVRKLTGGLGQLCKQRKIEFLQGKACFTDNRTVECLKADGGRVVVSFDHAILATGSRSATVPGIEMDPSCVWDSNRALELSRIPSSMLVIGAGYIGLEIGSIYASFGSEVSLVEILPGILPGADEDLTRILMQRLRGSFRSIRLNTRVQRVSRAGEGVEVVFRNADGSEEKERYGCVLVTVGRRPNSGDIGLEKTGIQLDKAEFVQVNDHLQTSESRIYAIGDVIGGALLAHKATREGRLAVEHMLGRPLHPIRTVPAVLFTDPEIAWCGLTESEAKKMNREVKVSKFPWGACGRAATLGRSDGLTKYVVDPATEEILGVGIAGPGAGELVSEGALAIQMGAKLSDIAATVHPHPTLSETLMEAAEAYFGLSTHFMTRKG